MFRTPVFFIEVKWKFFYMYKFTVRSFSCKLVFLEIIVIIDTIQKMKFSIKDFVSKCDQIHSFLRIWSHVLKKSLMANFIF